MANEQRLAFARLQPIKCVPSRQIVLLQCLGTLKYIQNHKGRRAKSVRILS